MQPHTNYRPSSAWSPHADQILMTARAKGMNWGPMRQAYFPLKTPNACRKRHERLMEQRNTEDWDGVKLETLAQMYVEVRKEMWSVLADRLGEKWQIIEAKCMEKGFKNLNAAARSASKRSTGTDVDDRGVGMEETENDLDRDRVDNSASASAGHCMDYSALPIFDSRSVKSSCCPIASVLSPPMPTHL